MSAPVSLTHAPKTNPFQRIAQRISTIWNGKKVENLQNKELEETVEKVKSTDDLILSPHVIESNDKADQD
ncbi:MAG: hypothetical protein K1000chlam2_00051 [Chlamydiae bacterium]|nr:hypothetical protein [Chlamydiota bacterium]